MTVGGNGGPSKVEAICIASLTGLAFVALSACRVSLIPRRLIGPVPEHQIA